MSAENGQIQQNSPFAHGDEGAEIRRHLGILRGRFWTIFACFVIIFSVVAIRTFRAVPAYRASARLLIEKSQPVTSPFDQTTHFRFPDREYYDTQAQIITSRDVMEKAVNNPAIAALFRESPQQLEEESPGLVSFLRDELQGLLRDKPVRPMEPWERLRDRIETHKHEETSLLDISVSGRNPEQCALIANAVAEAYLEYSIELRRRTAGETFESLQDVRREQERALEDAEEKLYSFLVEATETEAGLTELEATLDERIGTLNSELTSVQMQLMETEVALEAARQVNPPKSSYENGAHFEDILVVAQTMDDRQVAATLDNLRRLDLERAETPAGYGPRHPELMKFDAKRSIMLQQISDAVSAYTAGLETKLEVLTQRRQSLETALEDEYQMKLSRRRSSIARERFHEHADRHEKYLDVILDRLRAVDLGRDTELTNTKIVEQASIPASPFSPNRPRSLAFGIMLGLFVGVGMAYFHEWMDDTVTSPDDLELRANLPVLGYVPELETAGEKEDFVEVACHNLNSPHSPASELFRSIRTNLYFSGVRDASGSSLVVVSAYPESGKSVFSANLAVSLARDDNQILLVDADLRRSKIHQAFGLKRSPGLTNILVGEENLDDVVISPEDREGNVLENLHVLCSGGKSPNPAELIGGEAMGKFMAVVRDRYDMVIYDSGASLMIADTRILASRSDGALMIVRAGECRLRMLERVTKQLNMANCRVVGTVLNRVRRRMIHASYGYGGYYGYGYGYGYYDDEE